jgi:hypothetical protein
VNPDPLAFFDRACQSYQAAVTAIGGSVDRFYQIDEFVIKLQFAGAALIPQLTRALKQLEIPPTTHPNLTICAWDSMSTNISMPPPPWKFDDYLQRGEIRGFITDRFHTSVQGGVNALSMLDRDRNLAVYWLHDRQQIPFWESGAPFRTILHVWLSRRGIQLVHGGAVGTTAGGVLVVGKSGAGKSTTALSCLDSELSYAGDDYILVKVDPVPKILSLYSTGKKNADDLERLSFLNKAISNQDRLDTEKALYFIDEHFPQKMIAGFPLKAILIPRITGRNDTSIESASGIVALSALAPSTIFQLAGAKNNDLEAIAKIVKQVDCYYLNLGTNIAKISGAIIELLNQSIAQDSQKILKDVSTH